jgi:hypothetical protein
MFGKCRWQSRLQSNRKTANAAKCPGLVPGPVRPRLVVGSPVEAIRAPLARLDPYEAAGHGQDG